MSNSAWCDLISKDGILKLNDKCPSPKCNCQKVIIFTPHQYMLAGGSIECKLQKTFRGTQTAGKKFLKPTINATAPFIGMALVPKQRVQKLDRQRIIFQNQFQEVKIYH